MHSWQRCCIQDSTCYGGDPPEPLCGLESGVSRSHSDGRDGIRVYICFIHSYWRYGGDALGAYDSTHARGELMAGIGMEWDGMEWK